MKAICTERLQLLSPSGESANETRCSSLPDDPTYEELDNCASGFEIENSGLPYDLYSIMHYSGKA